MELDLAQIVPFLSSLGIGPGAIAIISVFFLVGQYLAGKKGVNLSLAGLIEVVKKWFGKFIPLSPVSPSDPVSPMPKPDKPDPLEDKPVLKFLRDLALRMFRDRVDEVLLNAKDEEDAALKVFSALKVKQVKTDEPK